MAQTLRPQRQRGQELGWNWGGARNVPDRSLKEAGQEYGRGRAGAGEEQGRSRAGA